MLNLPINAVLSDIQNTLNTHHRAVLQAPPGAGKTTAVPIALLDQPWLKNKQIIVLEPRRLAARNAAARMAYLLGEKVGERVGYQIRQDSCLSAKTKILVVTEGILTRKLQADPELKNTALVIFDEFHERSLHADLSLALCLQSQQILREDLKILVMSATLNTSAVSTLLNNAPIIQSEGRSFPVEINYLDRPVSQHGHQPLIASLMNILKQVIEQHAGNCLVFLPGVKEINQLAAQLKQYIESAAINNIVLAPLHGNLSKQQQDLAIASSATGQRKIVLATNIAETSITIEGISCVVDSGLERILDYSPASGMNRLKTQFISQDSAEQRSGRAGRLSAGVCYRLWTAPHLQHHLHEYIVIANLDEQQGEARIYLAADINAQQLQDYFSANIQQQETVTWNDTLQRVEARQTTSIGKIVLQEALISDDKKSATRAAIQQCLIAAIRNAGLQCLNWSPTADSLSQRVQFINHHLSHNQTLKAQLKEQNLPDFSDEALVKNLETWLQPHLSDETSIKQCAKLNILLSSQLSWDQQQLLNKLAPEKITVPSGSAISIDYTDPVQPVLAVRLQEVFGLYETPTVLNGHCKLMMHLLSPARRPMQVTQDLNSFWQTTYHEVKKELRGKYKRHYWPDDPFNAQATSKTKKQMNR